MESTEATNSSNELATFTLLEVLSGRELSRLLYRNALGEISGSVHIAAAEQSNVIRQ